MAVKRTPATEVAKNVAKNTSNPLMTMSLDVDKNDVIAIVISRAEAQLNVELKNHMDSAKLAEAEANTIETRILGDFKKSLTAQYAGNVSLLNNSVNVIDPSSSAVLSVERLHNQTSAYVFRCTVGIKTTGNNRYDHTFYQKEYELTEVYSAQLEQAATLRRQATEAKVAAIEVRRKLANIGTMERQARAKMAESQLSKTSEGKDFLDALESNFESMLKSIPSY